MKAIAALLPSIVEGVRLIDPTVATVRDRLMISRV